MNRVRATVVAASALALLAASAAAGTFRVPSEDHPTIQSAVDAAVDGDRILVAPGTYDEAVVVDGKNRLQILGARSPAVTGTGGTAAFVVRNCEGTRVAGFLVDSGSAGVVVSNAAGVRIERIVVRNPLGSGVRVSASDEVLVKACRVENALQPGVVVQDPAGVRVEKCAISGGMVAGIQVTADATVRGTAGFAALVQKNRILAVAGNGIESAGAGVSVAKNVIEGAAQDGILMDGAVDGGCVVSKNRIATSTGAAVTLNGQQVLAEKNSVSGGGNGIQALGAGGHALEKNRVRAVGGDGIVVGSPDNALEKNIVALSLGNGVHLQTSGNAFVKNKAAKSGNFDLLSTVAESENTFLGDRFGTTSFPE
jgi:F-box protein 11